MTSRAAATLGILGALALSGCAGAGADVPQSSEVPTATEKSPDAHSHHHHDHDEHDDLVVEAMVEPACVKPGGTMTITVNTAPRTGVLYLAYYSDGEHGAREPMGAGYGGNGGGYADDAGSYEDSWTVSDDAPPGPGRIKIVTVSGHEGESTEFTVADPDAGDC